MMESENIKATATKAAAPRPAASATPAAPAENELKPAFLRRKICAPKWRDCAKKKEWTSWLI